MLLYLTAPRDADEAAARAFARSVVAAWPGLAATRPHPRGGAPLLPVVTRLDLFLEAFSPAASPGSGLAIDVPAADGWPSWVSRLRPGLRELIRSTFPVGPRFGAGLDPVGPRLARPVREGAAPQRTLVEEMRRAADPAQRPLDPRLWLVLAPPLPAELELALLPSFLRAEPFARVARAPAIREGIEAWLAAEVDPLLAGRGLVVEGLVTDLERPGSWTSVVSRDGEGRSAARTELVDLLAGLEDLYASWEVLEPGEVYNRLHSHTGSEELYVVLEGEGLLRVNERLLPIRAGQCFGKPRGRDCATQLVNTGSARMVFLDVGTLDRGEVDLCRYPEHGELLARFGGHRWLVPTEAILPGAQLGPLYDRRYFRVPR